MLSRRSRNRASGRAWEKSPIESKPVSGPSAGAAACCCCAGRRGGTAAPSRARGPAARADAASPSGTSAPPHPGAPARCADDRTPSRSRRRSTAPRRPARARDRRRGSPRRGTKRGASRWPARSASTLPIEVAAAASSRSTQAFNAAGIVGGHDTVGPERGHHARLGIRPFGDRRVVVQRVDRVVGRADDRHAELPQQPLRREVGPGEELVAVVADPPRGVRLEQLRDAERTLQLQVRPVVERVAQRVRHRLRPRLELLPVRRVAGAEPLRHAVGAHRPPLVVIAVQPDLGDRGEAVVLGDLGRPAGGSGSR